MSFITATNIKKSYGQNLVIEDASFQIDEGKFYTILGLNGTGKSTLLNVLSQRITKDQSTGLIFGKRFGEDIAEYRNDIAYVSELLGIWSGFDLKSFLDTYTQFFSNWDQEYFESIITNRKLDLSGNLDKFSRGQKMQFFLSVALAQRPKIIFVDEITSVLDYRAREYFLNELNRIKNSGGTVVLTTNIITEVHEYTTDLIILKNRKILYQGTKQELFSKYTKIRDLETIKVPRTEKLFGLGVDSKNRFSYLLETSEISQTQQEFIHPEGANLGEVFMYLSEVEDE